MPRRSLQDKARTHEQIVDIAAERIRQDGTEAPSVADIMQSAGLTHGGFYKHFDSRNDLIAEAVERTFAEGQEATEGVIAGADDPLRAFVDWYVSADHRDNPGTGCGVVALGADVARSDPRVRAAYTEQVKRYLAQLEQLLGNEAEAAVALSTLVGAVLVARAVDDPDLSEEILADVRAAFS
jgi:TetR/AcrR family transcriptional regulator, transcriptional repressor for nem operon